jgi:RNA polymerase sigma factor (sigma-70 family)
MTDNDILAGLKQNDPRVFQFLYKTYGGKVLGIVMQNSGSREDGEDLLHELVLTIWQNVKADKYTDMGKFQSYFFTVAYQMWLNILRGRKVHGTKSVDELYYLKDDSTEELMRSLVKNRHLEAVYKGLEQLGEMCQDILRKFHLEDKSSKHLAAELGINDNAMRVRLFDCRQKLKVLANKILGNNEDDFVAN